jgi:hypothetical protein
LILLCGAGPATQPSTQPATQAETVSQRIDSMLKPMPSDGSLINPTAPPAVDASSGQGALAPNTPVANLKREGTYIVDRVARLSRGADGHSFELTFESDGKAMEDPPVIVLPGLKLESMEKAAGGGSTDTRFRVTGMLTEYHGRNYILLEKVRAMGDADQPP